MKDVIIDTLLDSLKLIPFLVIAFLIIELIEHKFGNKSKDIVSKSGKFGPALGALIGCFPQCGFSVMATNLYVTRIITLGTLISIYLSTSDEMLPILISEKASLSLICMILIIKVLFAMCYGFIIDIIFNKEINKGNYSICNEEHCHCDDNIIKSVLIHTLKTLIFIFVTTFILNIIMHYYGESSLNKIMLNNRLLGPIVSSLIGLLPNCGASVIITELYLKNAISIGSLLAGLLTGSGVALLVLFRTNKNLKENFKIVGIVYLLGVISGLIIEGINILL